MIMDIKKLLIGGILAGILFFLLGWLIYGNLLADYMKAHPGAAGNLNRADADMDLMYLAIGNLMSGFLMAYIFIRANVNTPGNGFVTGGVVGLLMGVSYDCIMYATSTIASKHMMLADVLASAAMSAVVGAIVGLVMGKLGKAA
jgi:sterol desaturase/sphingolipid hydroxylase (fatty acid hydroxylase superfamily)